jgi:hypothetical protein
MDRQARTGDTVLVKSKEMAGRRSRSETLPWWLGGEGEGRRGKDDTKSKYIPVADKG